MSAKHSRKNANPATPTPANAPASTAAGEPARMAAASTEPAWLDSTDPNKRRWGKIIFFGIWIYVGALWLLALDQTFHWGIFGPKVPPLP
ncbi:MAG: hypothetical protein EXS37_02925 [Opitutus sp.]|nr:hypothetical protein [Opitutus sp.]